MTIAELAILGVVFVLLLWALQPLQRMVRNVVERFLLRGRHGKVIEGRFKAVPSAPVTPIRPEPEDDPPKH